jgi:redox-regulated HSP33 family molecular chaperone
LTLADTTAIVQEGIQRHHLSAGSAKIYGKAMSAMTFMSACLKEETGEISLSMKGDGEMGEIGVSGNRKLNLRGYILNTIIGNYNPEASVIITTHLITDIEPALDEFAFMGGGKIIFQGNCDEIREKTGKSIDMLFKEVFRC